MINLIGKRAIASALYTAVHTDPVTQLRTVLLVHLVTTPDMVITYVP